MPDRALAGLVGIVPKTTFGVSLSDEISVRDRAAGFRKA
jgi:hypothetical protein